MYSESDLDAAIAAGALSVEQARTFRDFVAQGRHLPAVDEEHFRLLTGFNDIFVAIAAVILLVAVGWIGYAIPPRIENDGPSLFIGLFVAGAAWGLAEFFTRKRRMALPSILLLLAFVGGIFEAAAVAIVNAVGEQRVQNDSATTALILALSAAVAAAGAWMHWRRFHVPITVAAGAATAAGLVLGLVAYAIDGIPIAHDALLVIALGLGVGVFLFAMWWDSSDLRRQTRRTDVAFWLHLLAAPMIVHPIFSLLGVTHGQVSTIQAVVVLLVYLALGFTALAVDRRALLVSALAYVLFALDSIFRSYGVVQLSVAFTALVIGSALLLLSAFWHHARRMAVGTLPEKLQIKLPVLDRPVAA